MTHSVYLFKPKLGGTPNVSNISRSGNQRQDYYYDDNGNVTCVSDIEDEWSRVVSYNILNLPAVSVEGYLDTDCQYLADGTKRSVINTFGSDGNIYAGPFRYRMVNGDRAIADCAAVGGRFLCLNSTVDMDYDYPELHEQYFFSDHLDNTRAIFDDYEGDLVAKLDYAPFGRIVWNSGVDVNNNSYLWTGKELHYQLFDSASYDSSARFLFIEGSFTSIDPLAEKYPGISPYAYCAGDPVNLLDTNGCSISTHTDAFGNVVAVYNDGDLGVYRHNGNRDYTKNEVRTLYSDNNISAGGAKMGESIHIFSFANSTTNKKIANANTSITIDFNSTELTDAVQSIIDANPSLSEYMKNAQKNGIWDLKKQEKYKHKGSLLFGKYASPRDAGNFVAGYFSASRGVFSPTIDFGYGFYNLSGNNTTRTCINAALFVMAPIPLSYKGVAFVLIGQFGENKISRLSQMAGKQFYKSIH